MWVVTLHHDDGYGVETKQVICGADSEESAKNAGRSAVKYYAGPALVLDGHIEGHHLPTFWYSVKEHNGEWI